MDWLSLPDFTELPNLLLAQTPSPSPSSSPSPSPSDLELLKSQLEFLKQSHNQFSESMKQFVDTMRIIFIVLGIAGGVVAYFFGKSFKDFQEFAQKDIKAFREFAKEDVKSFREFTEREVQGATESFKNFQDLARKDIKDFQEFSRRDVQDAIQRIRQEAEAQIPRLVETEVGDLIRAEVASVERTLRREQVIGSTIVDYYLPNGTSEPKEVELLRARKFKDVHFCRDIEALSNIQSLRRSPSDVVVLDLINYITALGQSFPSLQDVQERDTAAQPIIDELLALLSDSTVLIVYVNVPPPLRHLNSIPKNRYVVPANSPITLVGNAADGAYVVAGDRRARNA